MTTEWELDAAGFEEAQAVYSPTADDWAGFEEWLDSLPEQLPTPEDFADPELCDHDEAARVAAWLERHGLAADFF